MYHIFRRISRNFSHVRQFSSNEGLVGVHYVNQAGRDKDYQVAVMKLNNPPVNSLSTPLLTEMRNILQEIATSNEADGLVITSSLTNTFSAGLELKELINTDRDRLSSYWTLVQECWYSLYSSQLPTVAALNGHCLAGGTIIAVAMDYRVAVASGSEYGIGVTAAKIGLVAPVWFQKNIQEIIGSRQTQLMLLQGKVFTPVEALSVGLVDKICDREELLSTASLSLLPFMETYMQSRTKMKLSLRSKLIREFETCRDKDREDFVEFVMNPVVQDYLSAYIEKLKKR